MKNFCVYHKLALSVLLLKDMKGGWLLSCLKCAMSTTTHRDIAGFTPERDNFSHQHHKESRHCRFEHKSMGTHGSVQMGKHRRKNAEMHAF